MSLEGKSITLHPMTDDDLKVVARWMNGEVARNFYRNDPTIYSSCSGEFDSPYAYVIKENETDNLGGMVKFRSVCPLHQSLIYDIYVASQLRSTKVAIEATILALDYAFDYLNIHRVEMTVYSTNAQALEVSEKFGFTREGVRREAIMRHGARIDVVFLSMLCHEYKESLKIARWRERLLPQHRKQNRKE